ncbi:MAG: polysaccharide deacetylase family protein [Betaproteobacteria bacterium]|nr:polysaccharide deacetylase family protein [Betaproteobacteria bacterium]
MDMHDRLPALARALTLALCVAALAGCSLLTPAPGVHEPAPTTPPPPGAQTRVPDAPWAGATGEVLGSGDRLLVYLPRAGDTLRGLAARFLGQADKAWQIEEANGLRGVPIAGQPLVVPVVPRNPRGITTTGMQTVTVLCYHRFGAGNSKMIVSPARFEEQMAYLAGNGYHVVRLTDLQAFLAGERALPAKSVVITFDDGYESAYRHAFPVLKKHNFPATLFAFSDFIGAPDSLTWPQFEEMARSGLVDLQAHSKTHRNLAERKPDESEDAYRKLVDIELRTPRTVLEARLAPLGIQVRHFAYPYGSANEVVLDAMQRADYELGLTVNAGGNAFFAAPLMLRRTMIYGDHSLADFQARLQVQRPLGRP